VIWDDLLAMAVGADIGLQERANKQMRERGEEPTFWQRHPVLPYLIGAVLGVAVLPLVLIFVVPNWMTGVVWLDQHLGNTGVVDLLGFTAFLWVPGVYLFIRAERRARRPQQRPPGTSLVKR